MKKFLKTMFFTLLFIPMLFMISACDNKKDVGDEDLIQVAYALAEERGYTGTLEEFIEAIKGDAGVGIESINYASSNGLVDTYEITLTNGGKIEFSITNGNNGNGITGVTKGTAVVVDGRNQIKYTILYTNGSTYDFYVTDGKDGNNGFDGISITKIEKTNSDNTTHIDTYTITYSNKTTTTFTVTNGTNGVDGIGIKTIAKTSSSGLIDTYTITYSDSTEENPHITTFTVTNGEDGEDGADGIGIKTVVINNNELVITLTNNQELNLGNIKGEKGETGKGIFNIEKTNSNATTLVDTYTITYTDKTTTTFYVQNGKDGINGLNGVGISEIIKSSNENVDTYTIVYSDSTEQNPHTFEFTVTNGQDGINGKHGVGIKDITKTSVGLVDTYTIVYSDSTEQVPHTFSFSITNGTNGTDGVGIKVIARTSTNGLVDTYTITYTDDTTDTFTVTNGKDGNNGADGIGIKTIVINNNELVITLTNNKELNLGNIKGEKGETGNGIDYIEKTSATGLIDTYTIYYTNNTTKTFTIVNGSDGKGIDRVEKVSNDLTDTYTIYYTQGEPYTFTLTNGKNGTDGQDGVNGKSAYEIYKEYFPTYSKTEYEWILDLVNGELIITRFTVTFDSNGGTEVDSQSNIKSGGKAIEPIAPTKKGYLFAGWYYGDEKWNFIGFSVTENITLTAKWVNISYTLTLNANGGQVEENQLTNKYGENYILPIPTRTGYSFDGWYKGQDLLENGVWEYESNFTAVAHWNPLNFNVNYYVGNELIDTDSVIYDDNYTFKNYATNNQEVVAWNYNENSYLPNQAITFNYTSDINLSAELAEIYTSTDFSYSLNGNEVTLTEYNGSSVDIVIPNYINDSGIYYKVVSLDAILFQSSNIQSVYIPNTITSMGSNVFYLCESLESVIFEENSKLKEISKNLFGCTSITSFVLPSSVKIIGSGAFQGCEDLLTFTVEENSQLNTIQENAFYNCNSLLNIQLPKEVKRINNSAFYNCNSLVNVYFDGTSSNWVEINFADRYSTPMCNAIYLHVLDEYGAKIYNNKTYSIMENIVLLDNITAIKYQFYNMKSLKTITLSSSIVSLGDYAFYGCSNLTEIIIPNSVIRIGQYCFNQCINLKTVIFEQDAGLLLIGDIAFAYCSKLESIIIPKTVINIKTNAFSACGSLENVYYLGSVSDWQNIIIDSSNTNLTNANIYYYSETEPTDNEYNYWHYNEQNEATSW